MVKPTASSEHRSDLFNRARLAKHLGGHIDDLLAYLCHLGQMFTAADKDFDAQFALKQPNLFADAGCDVKSAWAVAETLRSCFATSTM